MQILIYVVVLAVLFSLPPARIALYRVGTILVNHPIITSFALAMILGSAVAFGYLFLDIYTTTGIIALAVLSIMAGFFKPAAYLRNGLLLIGLIFWLGAKIIPLADGYIQNTFPSYTAFKQSEKEKIDSGLAEKTVKNKLVVMSSDVTKGTFGHLTEDSAAYDENGNPIQKIQKGQRIMSLGLLKKNQQEDPPGSNTEGMAIVSVPNEHGDFWRARTMLVPIRKIRWEEKPAAEKPAVQSPSPTPPAEKITALAAASIQAMVIHYDDRPNKIFNVVDIKRTSESLKISTDIGFTITASSGDGKNYSGYWKSGNAGEGGNLQMTFLESGKVVGSLFELDRQGRTVKRKMSAL